MTSSTSQLCELTLPRRDIRPSAAKPSAAVAADSRIGRLKAFLLGRRPDVRRQPPLKNAHYIAVHMVAATTHQQTLR